MSDETRDAAAATAEFLRIFEEADATVTHNLKKSFLNGFVGGYRLGKKVASDKEDTSSPEHMLRQFFIKANESLQNVSKDGLTDVRRRVEQTGQLGVALGWFLFTMEKLLPKPEFEEFGRDYEREIIGQVNVFAAKLRELERGIPAEQIEKRVRRIAYTHKGKLSKGQQHLFASIAAAFKV